MEDKLETRTRSAQHAVDRARKIVLQNNKLVDDIHEIFDEVPSDEHIVNEKERKFDEENEYLKHQINFDIDYKINTSSKIKNYFKDIINSMN